jgi:hypothetical protein
MKGKKESLESGRIGSKLGIRKMHMGRRMMDGRDAGGIDMT